MRYCLFAPVLALFVYLIMFDEASAQTGQQPQADKRPRHALIVTNQDYPDSVGKLSKTHEDGRIVSETLAKLGFDVEHLREATRDQLVRAFSQFAVKLGDPSSRPVGFFYYAGHGAARATRGENFIIPVKAPITHANQLPLLAVGLGTLIDSLPKWNGASTFMAIDACRNVSFPAETRGARGLFPVPEQSGLMISFSTSPGRVAVDANHYSSALAAELSRENIPAYAAFRGVRRRVLAATDNRQFPWIRDGLVEEFYFNRTASDTAGTAISPPPLLQLPNRIKIKGQTVFRDPRCNECPDMVSIQMSAPATETDTTDGARKPRVWSFAISRFEVTFDDWSLCAADKACRHLGKQADNGWGQGKRPVINVTWNDANAYAKWLADKTGKPYRLPTEAEWQFAARAGQVDDFAPTEGDSWCRYANGNTFNLVLGLGCDDGARRQTREVGKYESNAWGLHDMAGNVWEWVDDCWRPEPGNKAATAQPSECRLRTIKGGSWRSPASSLLASARRPVSADYRSASVGFRVARTLGPEQ